MSNSFDPDQARHFVWPDLSSNCLQRLSAGDTSKQRVKVGIELERCIILRFRQANILSVKLQLSFPLVKNNGSQKNQLTKMVLLKI